MSEIKINRAVRIAEIGRYPGSVAAMLTYVPEVVRAQLTSNALASLLDQLWSACQDAKLLANREAIEAGAIWDGQAFREIAT